MSEKNCPVCNKSFEGDENQVYCSSSCKQDAYRKRKKAESLNRPPTRISLEEFNQVLETDLRSKFESNFILYVFMRKNLPEKISFERLVLFLKHNIDEFSFISDSTIDNKSWRNFKELFYNGEFEIIENYQELV